MNNNNFSNCKIMEYELVHGKISNGEFCGCECVCMKLSILVNIISIYKLRIRFRWCKHVRIVSVWIGEDILRIYYIMCVAKMRGTWGLVGCHKIGREMVAKFVEWEGKTVWSCKAWGTYEFCYKNTCYVCMCNGCWMM